MQKNGVNIKCKNCKKELYVPQCLKNKKKYCSRECAFKDNIGFKPKKKKCVICNKDFIIYSQLEITKKTCSINCHTELVKILAKRSKEKRRKIIVKTVCKECKKEFNSTKLYKKVYCSNNCQYSYYKKNRIGKNNPSYRNGYGTKKVLKSKNNIYTSKHLRACAKYKKTFIEKNDYLFCENCGVSNSLSFNTHHIYYASRFPKHPQLHNHKNLILVCIQCHNDFHSGKLKEKFEQLEKERGLKKLFN